MISVFDGSTFAVSDERGDMERADVTHGFFVADTRHLSVWRLFVDGRSPEILSVADVDYFVAQFFLVPPRRALFSSPEMSIIRRRAVQGSWLEEITVVNHRNDALQVELRLEADADFADLFEVKGGRIRERPVIRRTEGEELCLRYRCADFMRETRISTDADATVSEDGFEVVLELSPREETTLSFTITPEGAPAASSEVAAVGKPGQSSFERVQTALHSELDSWFARAPRLETDWELLGRVYRRSLADLAALRVYPQLLEGESLPAAGLPWFMTAFGRDSLITSYQALPFTPQLARATLRALAARQAVDDDAFRDAEPGKILHEIRFGELTQNGELPYSPYYGSADSTPLFLIVLDEFERWTGDRSLVRELEPNARAALEWIDRHGDRDGDGYVEYERRNRETGLRNQCWKDSWNSILFADGRLAETPIATCEIQGYVFDAKRRCARLAAEVWGDAGLAERLRGEAEELRARFERDFWLEERGHYALALDREKRPVDSLTSNVGHLLWSGIAAEDRALLTAKRLLSRPLFSGWGVRTMAADETGYSPVSYHNGTVWPHDNSLIARGLARYGFRAEAGQICVSLLEAATGFDESLPEVFAGYDLDLTRHPVEFPTACQPQAWAAAAPLLMIRTMLGLEPDEDRLTADPFLPARVGRLELHGVPGRWGRAIVDESEVELSASG
ncbi:MAG TPA: glycogen debranching N-terminal domain-containing protein [Solirubrobacterales bacterium]|nr:glycogen debranching N-terminal domain-containing protein [Solirubrobacterales bacterium]